MIESKWNWNGRVVKWNRTVKAFVEGNEFIEN